METRLATISENAVKEYFDQHLATWQVATTAFVRTNAAQQVNAAYRALYRQPNGETNPIVLAMQTAAQAAGFALSLQ